MNNFRQNLTEIPKYVDFLNEIALDLIEKQIFSRRLPKNLEQKLLRDFRKIRRLFSVVKTIYFSEIFCNNRDFRVIY